MAETTPQPQAEKKYVGIARTALSGPENTITKPLPADYVEKTVGDVLDYLVEPKGLKEDEKAVARSIRAEMGRQYTVSANGRTVAPGTVAKELFERREYRGVPFEALEIEIASVQEGGLEQFLF